VPSGPALVEHHTQDGDCHRPRSHNDPWSQQLKSSCRLPIAADRPDHRYWGGVEVIWYAVAVSVGARRIARALNGIGAAIVVTVGVQEVGRVVAVGVGTIWGAWTTRLNRRYRHRRVSVVGVPVGVFVGVGVLVRVGDGPDVVVLVGVAVWVAVAVGVVVGVAVDVFVGVSVLVGVGDGPGEAVLVGVAV